MNRMEKVCYFVAHKSATLEDLIKTTGVNHNDFWFEYFLNLFSQHCTEICEYETFIKLIDGDKQHIIKQLSENFNIDGLTFFDKKVFVFKTSDEQFNCVSFKLIKSKKIKVIYQDELL